MSKKDSIDLNEDAPEKNEKKSGSIDVNALLKDIRKVTDSSSFKNSQYAKIDHYISTGDYGLNRIISGDIYKGIPAGKVVIIAGSSQTGKTYLVAGIAANALNIEHYDVVFYFDSEGGALEQMFLSRKCDTNKIEHILVDDVEDAHVKILSTYAKINEYKKEHPEFRALMLLDSLGALVDKKTVNDVIVKDKVVSDMGSRARACNKFIKSLTIPALRSNTSIVITNHIYDDPSAMYASKIKNQSGGKGTEYMSRITLQCTKLYEKTEESKEDEKNFYAAAILKFFTIKNSMVKPFYETEMYLSFSKGPSKYFGLLKPAIEYGFVTNPSKGKYQVPLYGEKLFKIRALLECDEAWEKILPQFNERSLKDLSYSGDEKEALELLKENDTNSDEDISDIIPTVEIQKE